MEEGHGQQVWAQGRGRTGVGGKSMFAEGQSMQAQVLQVRSRVGSEFHISLDGQGAASVGKGTLGKRGKGRSV